MKFLPVLLAALLLWAPALRSQDPPISGPLIAQSSEGPRCWNNPKLRHSAPKQAASRTHYRRESFLLTEKVLDSEFESEVRRIERNARVGYHFQSDPEDTSPFGVLRFTRPAYDKFNDGELIEMVREKFHPNIPKTDFHVWMRDPYGQEKIDSYVEHHKEARN